MSRDMKLVDPELRYKFEMASDRFEKSWLGKNYRVLVFSTLRTTEEQQELYWHSRILENGYVSQKYDHKNRPIRHLTYLDGVYKKSKHQANKDGFSEAIDFTFINKKTGKANWVSKVLYYVFGRRLKSYGLEWGGEWKFQDLVHVQLR